MSQKLSAPPPSPDDDTPRGATALPEVRIVIVYMILASLWIIGSDVVLSVTMGDGVTGVLQSLKGLNFVITTGILLFLVLHRAYGGWRTAEERRITVMRKARERYRNLCSKVQALREEDRTRIAREVHDELGQLLTGIKLNLRLIENRLGDLDDRALNPIIDKIVETEEMVGTTIVSVQRIAADLRPSALDHLGLSCALAEEAEQFTKRTGTPCELVIPSRVPPLVPPAETAVFRIFQESLTNVARHAAARRVEARLTMEEGQLRLSVRDDGQGIDAATVENPGSLGLTGMLERAENIGGSVTFLPHPSQGTEVVLSIPLARNLLSPSPRDPDPYR